MKIFKRRVGASTDGKPCELHRCLRHALRLARWAGIFPVEGLANPTPSEIRYKLKSLYGLYYFSFVIVQATVIILTIIWQTKIEPSFGSASITIFFSISFISTISFLFLAKRWPKLMETATEIEEGLDEIRISKYTGLVTHIVAYGVMLLALGEHLLYMAYNITTIIYCLGEDAITKQVADYYLSTRFSYIFHLVPYNIWFGGLALWIGLQVTFVWTFIDVLTICFSIYLLAYFNKMNRAITNGRNDPFTNWALLRAHYSRMVILVQVINRHICMFILTSMFTDLFYICLQLFNSLHRNVHPYSWCNSEDMTRGVLPQTYFVYSVVFLVFRTLLMSLSAASVHTAAKKPIAILYDVPASAYDMEVQRFLFQVRYTTVGLSGYFFYVNRNIMLQAISTIITYELVMLQLSTPASTDNSQMDLETTFVNATTALVP